MSLFVLVPGAGGSAWYWSRVLPLLRDAGHDAVAVDLPGNDERSGLAEYARLVVAASGARDDVVLVAQSLAGFTVPPVCAEVDVRSVVFVNAMIPLPGETPGQWWDHTGAVQARESAAEAGGYGEFDLSTYFLHDVPSDIAAEGESHQRPEADAVFSSVCEFTAWPAVPIRVLCGASDRFFPVELQRTVARERLGVEAQVLPGGHLIALAQPDLVADYLLQADPTGGVPN